MSDERPLSLRLRPRAAQPPTPSPEPAAPAPSDPAEQETPTAAAPTDVSRLRLRPKTPPPEGLPAETPVPFSAPPIEPPDPVLVPEPTGEAASTEDPVETTPTEATIDAPPADETLPDPAPADPEAVSEEMPAPAEPEPVEPAFVEPEPPSPEPEPVYDAAPPPPRPVQLPAPEEPAPTPPPTIKADKWLVGIVVVVLVMTTVFWGMHSLFKAHPKAKPVGRLPSSQPAEKVQAPAADPEAKPHLVDNPKSAAGKTIARARDIAAANDRRVTGMDEVLETPTPKTAPAAPSGDATKTVSPAVESKPVTTEPPPQPEPVAPASDEFRQFVAGLKVSGVFQGENARAMLNGKTYTKGDVIDVKLNITFFKVDPEARQLIFRDDTGATVSKRY